ncbi:hypothetical protein DAEQUDRAFT_660376 [Daedalea quercina L-15889]|uniref:Protein kinase domain-containing protein n=1 Tax=Daedalea quercina L-15889 TaxID=1314783 RepID=A0A165U8P4_9APHY|nr:hypothetical protein DAEQUDRAFT_660376 [Daedalea quercina L-15889]
MDVRQYEDCPEHQQRRPSSFKLQEVPGLSDDVPYNMNIYIIGNLLRRTFYDQYSNIDFLTPLFDPMVQHDPHARPAAAEVHQRWLSIYSIVPGLKRRWRLQPRSEPLPETVFHNLYTAVRAALHFRGYVVATCVFTAALYAGVWQ